MHAHVSYLTEDCPACLLMLTVERDAFFELSAAKQKIVTVSIVILVSRDEHGGYGRGVPIVL